MEGDRGDLSLHLQLLVLPFHIANDWDIAESAAVAAMPSHDPSEWSIYAAKRLPLVVPCGS